ncbi:hypothetical protein CLOP_g4704, partial [Closterium sp. NIES-67]
MNIARNRIARLGSASLRSTSDPAVHARLLTSLAAPLAAAASSAISPAAAAEAAGGSAGGAAAEVPPSAANAAAAAAPAGAAAGAAAGGAAGEAAQKGSGGARNPFLRAAQAIVGSAVLGIGGGCAYVTYAYENKEVAQWAKGKREEIRQRPQEGLDGVVTKGLSAAVDVAQWYVDTRSDLEERIHNFNQPASDRLLPDLTPQEQHVYTLVLDLEGTLVHSDWKRDRGWRTFKRPGVEAFLERMAQFFEVVVFSDQLNLSVDPILDRLDQKGCIRYRLYRDGTLYSDGN